MRIPCPRCNGDGTVITHGINDPRAQPVYCCEGYRDAEPEDLDGLRGRYRGMVGVLSYIKGTLILEDDDTGVSVVGLSTSQVEILHEQAQIPPT